MYTKEETKAIKSALDDETILCHGCLKRMEDNEIAYKVKPYGSHVDQVCKECYGGYIKEIKKLLKDGL